ncbi:MAG: sugar transporter ATP-binding protein, partial [Firmicutes bacterium]|nr:sugar transporter ATP-binding protein [Bacillota bacterium]
MQNIYMSFPGVRALQNVNFTLCEGEIHALMGENGAGKSTLIKVLTGVYTKDSGEIYIKGTDKPVHIKSPQDAQKLGISTVYQEITLCPNLTVAENLFIGRTNEILVDWKKSNSRAESILKGLGIPVKPTVQLSNCSIAVQQMVAIARAVDMDCKVLILDEPTSSLDEQEVVKLFSLMRELKGRGVGIIFVTHFLDQVYAVCDKITVLRGGELVGEYQIKELPRVELVAKMMGKELGDLAEIHNETQPGSDGTEQMIIETEELSSTSGIKPFNFTAYKGEVTGFAGLLGSGRSECVRAIFGADKVVKGRLKIKGENVTIKSPIKAMKKGIGYLSE